MTRAKVVYYDVVNDIANIQYGEHLIESGGMAGGYCYGHQSFHCTEEFTEEDWRAIEAAPYPEETP